MRRAAENKHRKPNPPVPLQSARTHATQNGIDAFDETERAAGRRPGHLARPNHHPADSRSANGHANVEGPLRVADACENRSRQRYRSERCIFGIQTEIPITVSTAIDARTRMWPRHKCSLKPTLTCGLFAGTSDRPGKRRLSPCSRAARTP